MRRILIAVPTYSGEIVGHAMLSILRAVEEGRAAGWRVEVAMRPLDSLLPRSRNALLTRFLGGDADDLVFWDADVATEPGAFSRLMGHPVDFVGGAYPARSDPERYIFRQIRGDAVSIAGGLIEVEGLGCGFLRVTRAAVERMAVFFPELWVQDREVGRLVWLFDNALVDHEYWSEDFVFCHRWRAAGGAVWLDPELAFHHTGPKIFSGRYGDWLRRGIAAATTPEELAAEQATLDAALDAAGAATFPITL